MSESVNNEPMFAGIYGVLSTPIRQIYMMGAVWKLIQSLPGSKQKFLEIVSWAGLSSLTLAWALDYFAEGGDIHCIDPWLPYVDKAVNQEAFYELQEEAIRSGEAYKVFLHNIQFAPASVKVTHSQATSLEVLPTLPDSEFSLVYIDGDHAYKSVLHDIEQSSRLIVDGGIMCGDDLEVQAIDCHPALLELDTSLDYVEDTDAGISFHPGVTRAVAEIFGPVSAWGDFGQCKKMENIGLPSL
jgi:predicted O-methyltransferase YrrM